jgi:glutamate-1-semialdehyde aminotransferase
VSLTALNTKRNDGIAFVRGNGALLWTPDGSDYLDFSCCYGPIVLGYAHEVVNEAVRAQLARGTLFPWVTPEIDALAQQVLTHFPSSSACLFFKSGSEGVAAAVRLARATTGRTHMIRSGFHGWHDPVISPFYRWHDPQGLSLPGNEVPGIPHTLSNDWSAWDGRDMTALEHLFQARPIAGLIIDPIVFTQNTSTTLQTCRKLAHQYGALLILDEVKTGFRTALGGVQQLCNIAADLTVISKALGNGFPIAAVVCTTEVAGLAASAKVKGTYNSELVSVAAASATLGVLEKEHVPEQLNRTGLKLIQRFNEEVTGLELQNSVRAIPYRWPCMPHVEFQGPDARQCADIFSASLLRERIVWLPNHMNYISLAHTEEHIERFVGAAVKVLPEMLSAGANARRAI